MPVFPQDFERTEFLHCKSENIDLDRIGLFFIWNKFSGFFAEAARFRRVIG